VIIASFFGKVKGGNFIYWLCRVWGAVVLGLSGIFHRNIYAFPHDGKKQYVFVFNHISYLDIPVVMRSILRQKFRILGKSELTKIPLFGFVYKNAVVLVNRESTAARAKSVMQLKSVLKKGISIAIAPEGTFNMSPDPLAPFYDGAFRIAIETQTPIKPLLVLDTYDRLHYGSILSMTPGRSRTVFLEEIDVRNYTVDNASELKAKVFEVMENALIQYKASWIKNN
jgi:1-acyl-sn-glycerol-3-phosphate acyltransferase